MPYQLIYTSAARLLDSPLSGYGVVARSENMPAALVRTLVELSEYKEPADQGVLGPQFSYHVEECQNTLYHIFTSVRSAGADYSKRSCHIAHHLALRAEEMHALCQSSLPPTPAGILLTLELRRYWVHHWRREPEYLGANAMPPLNESPSASNFPTWLIFTGNAENARLFQMPPYHQGSLIIVPQKTQSRDLLRLLHESYTLLPTLGWGVAFSTYSVESDSLESTCRLFTVAGSALCQRALRSGFPMLELKPGLRVIPQSSPPPQTIPRSGMAPRLQPRPPQPRVAAPPAPRPQGQAAAAQSAPAAPAPQYSYAEDRSNDTFEHPWHKPKRKAPTLGLLYAVAALALCGAAWAGARFLSHTEGRHRSTPDEAEVIYLSSEPQSPAAAKAHHHEPIAPAPAPEQADEQQEEPTPEPVDEPTDEPTDEPEDEPTPPTVAEPAADQEPPTAAEEAPDRGISLADLTTGETLATVAGSALPEQLAAIIPGKVGESRHLHLGEYRIHEAHEQDDRLTRFQAGKKKYSAKGTSASKPFLELRRESKSKCSIIPADESLPTITLYLKDNYLIGITTEDGTPAAVLLPLADEEKRTLHGALLLPALSISLHTARTNPYLQKPKKPLTFNGGMLDWKTEGNTHTGTLSREKLFEKNPLMSTLRKDMRRTLMMSGPPTSHLPDIAPGGMHSEVTIAKMPKGSAYGCELRDGVVTLLRRMGGELCQRFDDKCLSQPSGIPMAHALWVIGKMANSNTLSDDLLRPYVQLFVQNDGLEKKLRALIPHELADCCLSANIPRNADKNERRDEFRRLKNALTREKRKALLSAIEAHLSEELTKLRDAILNEFNEECTKEQDYYLILKSVHVDKEQLTWTFELQQAQ